MNDLVITATEHPPVIGISGCSEDTPSIKSVLQQMSNVGAIPLFFGSHGGRAPDEDIEKIDALMVMGNDWDIDPNSYIHRYKENDPKRHIHPETKNELDSEEGRARASYEEAMIKLALTRKMPLLGICGGMQRINVLCGGTLHQHVPDLVGDTRHCQRTSGIIPTVPVVPIIIKSNTLLASIAEHIPMPYTTNHSINQPKVIVENSLHHQAVDKVAEGLRVSALSDSIRFADGTTGYMIKAIEAAPGGLYGRQFLLGVQWHPEFGASPLGAAIAQYLAQKASQFAKAK